MWIGAGSRYENEKNNGAGYFVEHLAFKVRLGLAYGCMETMFQTFTDMLVLALEAAGIKRGVGVTQNQYI